jgi:hypothetical protein
MLNDRLAPGHRKAKVKLTVSMRVFHGLRLKSIVLNIVVAVNPPPPPAHSHATHFSAEKTSDNFINI